MLEAFENAVKATEFTKVIDEIDKPQTNRADVLLGLSIGKIRFGRREVLLIDRQLMLSRFIKSVKSEKTVSQRMWKKLRNNI